MSLGHSTGDSGVLLYRSALIGLSRLALMPLLPATLGLRLRNHPTRRRFPHSLVAQVPTGSAGRADPCGCRVRVRTHFTCKTRLLACVLRALAVTSSQHKLSNLMETNAAHAATQNNVCRDAQRLAPPTSNALDCVL